MIVGLAFGLLIAGGGVTLSCLTIVNLITGEWVWDSGGILSIVGLVVVALGAAILYYDRSLRA
jgi:hypothetical protein